MKYFFTLILVFISTQAWSQRQCETSNNHASQIEELDRLTQMSLMFGWYDEMEKYSSDVCSTKLEYRGFFFKEVSSTYYRCKDGSISFNQPASTGSMGWNGFCGETSISNVLKMTCGENWHPDGTIHSLAADFTPGTRPSSLEYVLNELAPRSDCKEKSWTYYNTADSDREYIESIIDGLKSKTLFTRTREDGTRITRAPVPTLVKMDGSKTLHWITIVDVIGYDAKQPLWTNPNCYAVANQWGQQYKIPCSHLASMAEDVSDVMIGSVGKYVRIKQL
jgi:hypothetical protein